MYGFAVSEHVPKKKGPLLHRAPHGYPPCLAPLAALITRDEGVVAIAAFKHWHSMVDVLVRRNHP